MARHTIYILDASEGALLAEDFPGTTRLHFQRELVACHSGAAARPAAAADVAVIAAAAGRAAVALHPTAESGALREALDGLQPAGEANLEAALKLALLVSRRFPPGATHVTAFVASPGATASLAATPASAAELRQRYSDGGVSLDVAVLCSEGELGCAAAEALRALTRGDDGACADGSGASTAAGGEAAPSSSCGSDDSSDEEGAVAGSGAASGSSSSSAGANRLLWLTPVASAAESWQQLEPALEQLERRRSSAACQQAMGAADSANRSARAAGSSGVSALPRRISRAPRQADPLRHPRTSLLAARSGVQQPALCRGESLNRLAHLSSDGMMRPWLPTYASLGQQPGLRAAAAGGGGVAGPADPDRQMVYIEVQPIPRWRTLLKVAAGRMLPAAAAAVAAEPNSGGGSSGGGGGSPTAGYAAASSQLLRSLEALSVLDGAEGSVGSGSGADAAAPAAPAPVRYRPDGARGTLRLLQGTKEPHLLKLVWSADASRAAPGEAGSSQPAQQQQQQQQPLDMFGGGGGGGGASRRHSELLGYMPASAVAESAARGPIEHEGCELWEAAAEFDWELQLPTPESDGAQPAGPSTAAAGAAADGASTAQGSAASGSTVASSEERLLAATAAQEQEEALPARAEGRQLPNGAQLLLVTPAPSAARRGGRQQAQPAAAAFWLQQRVLPGSLAPPAYSSAAGGQGSAAARAGEPAAEPQGEGGAALLAAALMGHLRAPPAVDIRRLRKDVKLGAIKVTPISVGPLPAALVRDIIGTRSRLMSSLGVENFDSWDDGSPAGSQQAEGGASGPTSRSGSSSSSGGGPAEGGAGTSVGGDPAAAGGDCGGGGKGLTPDAAAAVMQRNKAAVLSLLRQRLQGRQPSGKAGGSGSASPRASPLAPLQEEPLATGSSEDCSGGPAAASAGAAEPAEPAAAAAALEPSDAIPCTPQQPRAAGGEACSYGSSTAGTPFGTPLHIVPSRLAHCASGGAHGAPGGGTTATGEAAPDGATCGHDGLPGGLSAGGELLPVGHKPPEGGAGVLVGGAGQGEAADADLFQLE